ncbi:MAG: DUF2341 domain-containing protein, partial [Verrucomicrobiota bacterium]
TNLLPDTVYYVGWQTTNRQTNIWDDTVLSFITLQPPQVDNGTGAVVDVNSATLSGTLLAGNEADVYLFWGTSDGGTNEAAWDNYVYLDTVTNGPHSGVAEGLLSCVTYYYRAYAENNLGGAWASTSVTFQVADSRFGVSNQPASDLTHISGRMNGTVDATGTIAHAWIYYGPTDGETNAAAWANELDLGTVTDRVAQLSHQVAGLSSNDTRYYTFRASNCLGETWAASSESFTITAGSYSNRLRIGFCAYSGSETLTDFPVLVKLGSHITGFDYAGFTSPTGGDLRFFDETETEPLDYDIELWDTNGTSLVWVEVPALSNAATAIFAKWGSSATNSASHTPNGEAWSANYRGVWHLGDEVVAGADTAEAHRDASSFANHADQSGNSNVASVVGFGQAFDGNDDNIQTPFASPLNPANLTISCWAWVNDVSYGALISSRSGSRPAEGYALYLETS